LYKGEKRIQEIPGVNTLGSENGKKKVRLKTILTLWKIVPRADSNYSSRRGLWGGPPGLGKKKSLGGVGKVNVHLYMIPYLERGIRQQVPVQKSNSFK